MTAFLFNFIKRLTTILYPWCTIRPTNIGRRCVIKPTQATQFVAPIAASGLLDQHDRAMASCGTATAQRHCRNALCPDGAWSAQLGQRGCLCDRLERHYGLRKRCSSCDVQRLRYRDGHCRGRACQRMQRTYTDDPYEIPDSKTFKTDMSWPHEGGIEL